MGKFIVIIDDDVEDIDFLRSAFLEIDPSVKCVCFTSPQDALQSLSTYEMRMPDAICVDYNMPVLNGMDCLRLFGALNRLNHTMIVANSTHLPISLENELRAQGASFAFQKPDQLDGYGIVASRILNDIQVSDAL